MKSITYDFCQAVYIISFRCLLALIIYTLYICFLKGLFCQFYSALTDSIITEQKALTRFVSTPIFKGFQP